LRGPQGTLFGRNATGGLVHIITRDPGKDFDFKGEVGYGNYNIAIDTLEKAISGRDYIAADHFTAADLFVGANINFMLAFNLLEPREAFVDYARRMTDRPAYRRAQEIDGKLIAEIEAQEAQAPQPD